MSEWVSHVIGAAAVMMMMMMMMQVNHVLELVPTAISLLDRLRIQADRVRRLGSELSANISNLRSQIDIARDQANLVSSLTLLTHDSWLLDVWPVILATSSPVELWLV